MSTTLQRPGQVHPGCADPGCATCSAPQLTRNTWFTGKLLTARDCTDEQHYFLGKHTRHNQYLHGMGIVCGLEVTEHPNPACRTTSVLVRPGVASDCCGHEILLTRTETVPLAELIARAWADDHPGPEEAVITGAHRIQLCLRYAECLTEAVESLLDPCGDTGCQPNRILDSYAFGVRIDPPLPSPPQPASLEWTATVAVAGSTRFALDAGGDRLYVLAGTSLLVFAATTGAVLAVAALPAAGLDVAVSRTGDRVYVAVADATPVLVLDPADLTTPVVALATTAAPTGAVRLAAPAGGGIVALDVAAATVYGWDASADTGADSTTSLTSTVTVGADPRALVVLADASGWLVSCGDGSATLVKAGTTTAATITLGADVVALAVVPAAGEQRILAVDATGTAQQHTVDLAAGTLTAVGSAGDVVDTPVAVAISAGGWAVVAGVDGTGQGIVRVLDVAGLNSGPVTAGPPIAVGAGPVALVVDDVRERVLVGFTGGADPATAGVAVLGVTVGACSLEPRGCPECSGVEGGDDCLVLTTIESWTPGAAFTDDVLTDTGRIHLPSVAQLAATVRCLLDRPTGSGAVGPAGPTGPQGLQGIQGIPGPAGPPGPDPLAIKLPAINGISWPHRGRLATNAEIIRIRDLGLVIGFTTAMDRTTLDLMSCAVFFRMPDQVPGFAAYRWCQLPITPVPVTVTTSCGAVITKVDDLAPPDEKVNGVLLPIGPDAPFGVYQIVLHGDTILTFDRMQKRLDGSIGPLALDGNHLGVGLPGRCPTGDRIEGGTFMSWFILGREKL